MWFHVIGRFQDRLRCRFHRKKVWEWLRDLRDWRKQFWKIQRQCLQGLCQQIFRWIFGRSLKFQGWFHQVPILSLGRQLDEQFVRLFQVFFFLRLRLERRFKMMWTGHWCPEVRLLLVLKTMAFDMLEVWLEMEWSNLSLVSQDLREELWWSWLDGQ